MMSTPVRLLTLALMLPLMFGLAHNPASANDLAKRAKSIGVLVLAGHEIELARVGAMVFWNKRTVVAAPDQALSDSIYQEIKAQLDQEEQFEVRRVPVPSSDLPRMAEQAQKGAGSFMGASLKAMKDELAPYRAACQCDALIVVAPRRGQMDPMSNQTFRSFAWVGFSGLDEIVRRSDVAGYLELFLLDPVSGQEVDNRINATDGGTINHAVAVHPDLWPKEMAGLAAEIWPRLTVFFAADLRSTLRLPLFQLGFKPSCGVHFFQVRYPVINRNLGRGAYSPQEPPALPDGAHASKCR